MKTPCTLWAGAQSLGYGKHHTTLAHREVWETLNGPIPAGWVVHHKCRVKLCVNPEHLQAMTRSEHHEHHKADKAANHRNAAKTHCPQGHEYTEANTYRYRNMRQCKACRLAVQRRK